MAIINPFYKHCVERQRIGWRQGFLGGYKCTPIFPPSNSPAPSPPSFAADTLVTNLYLDQFSRSTMSAKPSRTTSTSQSLPIPRQSASSSTSESDDLDAWFISQIPDTKSPAPSSKSSGTTTKMVTHPKGAAWGQGSEAAARAYYEGLAQRFPGHTDGQLWSDLKFEECPPSPKAVCKGV